MFTIEQLQKYAEWKENWLKEQGKTAEEVEAEDRAWLNKFCAGGR